MYNFKSSVPDAKMAKENVQMSLSSTCFLQVPSHRPWNYNATRERTEHDRFRYGKVGRERRWEKSREMKQSERKEGQLVGLWGKTELNQQEVMWHQTLEVALTSDPGGWCGIRTQGQLLPTPIYYRCNICVSENSILGVLIKLNWVVGRVRAHTESLAFSFYILNNYVLFRVILYHKERILTSFPPLFSDIQKWPLKPLEPFDFWSRLLLMA